MWLEELMEIAMKLFGAEELKAQADAEAAEEAAW